LQEGHGILRGREYHRSKGRALEAYLQVGCDLKKHLQRDRREMRYAVVSCDRWGCHFVGFKVFKRVTGIEDRGEMTKCKVEPEPDQSLV
jgi:hypothetical protein